MKATISAIIALLVMAAASPALAGGDWLAGLYKETDRDFGIVKTNFRAAYTAGYGSWEDYGDATGFSIGRVEERIRARRAKLGALAATADSKVDARTRGLVKLLIRDMDHINLSILALIRDDRGYAGYIRTSDETLVGPVSDWQEGIRQSLKELKRSMSMVRGIKANFDAEDVLAGVVAQ